MKPLLKPQTICKKSKIPCYGVVNVEKIWTFENHPTRVFLIHVFLRNLKLFMVFIFRLPSRGVLAVVFFSILATFTLETILELHQNFSYFLIWPLQCIHLHYNYGFLNHNFSVLARIFLSFLKPKRYFLKEIPFFWIYDMVSKKLLKN